MSVVTVTILSEGQTLDPGYELLSVDVVRELNRIPYASLTLIDGDAAQRTFALSDSGFFDPGKKIEIKLRYEGTPSTDKTVFKGLVVTHSVEAEGDTSTLSVRMKDAAVTLTQVRNNQLFLDQSDDQVVKQLIQNRGLTAGNIAATPVKHAELVQYGCSDWDFLLARAESNGLVVKVVDGTISLAKIESGGAAKRSFEYGIDELYSFEMEAEADGQYAAVSSVAWDSKTQKMTQAKQAKDVQPNPGDLAASKLASAMGGETCQLVNSTQMLPEELQAWADATLARSRLGMLRGRIAAPGSTDVELLDGIEIKGVGKRFNGTALVSGLRHRVTDEGWITDVQFGLSPEWLLSRPGAAANALPAGGLLPAIGGLHIGLVTTIESDPDNEFRVQVQIPTLGDQQNTLWARMVSPDAGKDRGYCFRPEVGDEVVIGFINQDPRQPIVLGALFGSVNKPPQRFGEPKDANTGRGIASKKGSLFGFDDEKVRIYLETPAGNKITLDDDAKSIVLADQHGNTVTLDQNGISLKSAKDLKLEASGNVTISGAKVDVQ